MVNEREVVERVRELALGSVSDFYRVYPESEYPLALVEEMRELGLFGATIPVEFGGFEFAPSDIGQITYQIARESQSLAGLLGTHYRACMYVQRCGTAAQRKAFLPSMATGNHVYAHAYHERNEKNLANFNTVIRGGELNGTKNWVTNARHANRIIVVARNKQATNAVIVDPANDGVSVGVELERPGMKGVSLSEVKFEGYRFDPVADVIGGVETDVSKFIYDNESGSAAAFAARSAASADKVSAWALDIVQHNLSKRSAETQGAISLRVGEMLTLVSAIRSTWLGIGSTSDKFAAQQAKVFCSQQLQEVLRISTLLGGGSAYAGMDQTLGQHYRDALALVLIDTPNDVLLSRIGADALGLSPKR